MGAGTLAMIGGTVVIVGFPHHRDRRHAGGPGATARWATSASGADRLPGGVHQRAHLGPGRRRYRAGGHLRRGVTAQLGAMRVNQEIDALESMAIRPIAFLVSTDRRRDDRDHPLYAIAVILSFLASKFTTVTLLGRSGALQPLLRRSSTRSTCCGRSSRPC